MFCCGFIFVSLVVGIIMVGAGFALFAVARLMRIVSPIKERLNGF
jgi:hypothetical protein